MGRSRRDRSEVRYWSSRVTNDQVQYACVGNTRACRDDYSVEKWRPRRATGVALGIGRFVGVVAGGADADRCFVGWLERSRPTESKQSLDDE